jgi:hypothetical protein
MRRVATLAMIVNALTLSAGLAPAAAEEPRYVPAAQTVATYRLTTVSTINGREITAAQIYRVTVTASDGSTAEATITPLALVYRCPADETSKDCRAAPHFPGASRDGDMVTIPVPQEVGANLAKLSKLTARDFLRVTQVFPMPGPEDIEEVDKPKIGDAPLYLLGSAIECDDALTKGFFPLGVAAQFSVSCKTTSERAQSRVPAIKDGKSSEDFTMALTFSGRDHIAVPAGDFAVAEVKYKSTPASGHGVFVEGEWAVAENLGISVRNSALVHLPNSQNTSHLTRELIKLGP